VSARGGSAPSVDSGVTDMDGSVDINLLEKLIRTDYMELRIKHELE
jgi:hypothetical protein